MIKLRTRLHVFSDFDPQLNLIGRVGAKGIVTFCVVLLPIAFSAPSGYAQSLLAAKPLQHGARGELVLRPHTQIVNVASSCSVDIVFKCTSGDFRMNNPFWVDDELLPGRVAIFAKPDTFVGWLTIENGRQPQSKVRISTNALVGRTLTFRASASTEIDPSTQLILALGPGKYFVQACLTSADRAETPICVSQVASIQISIDAERTRSQANSEVLVWTDSLRQTKGRTHLPVTFRNISNDAQAVYNPFSSLILAPYLGISLEAVDDRLGSGKNVLSGNAGSFRTPHAHDWLAVPPNGIVGTVLNVHSESMPNRFRIAYTRAFFSTSPFADGTTLRDWIVRTDDQPMKSSPVHGLLGAKR